MKSRFATPFRVLTLLACCLLAATAGGSVALADGVYHSTHIDLMPVGAAPLRSGFVENIHVNGPKIFAIEQYALNGATPNTPYQVTLMLYPFSADCSTGPVPVPTALLETNRAGNAVARAVFAPEDIPDFLREATHSARWLVWTGAVVAYDTACVVDAFD